MRHGNKGHWLRPQATKAGSPVLLNGNHGPNRIFREKGDGHAWDWIQLKGLRGWGMLKLTGTDFFMGVEGEERPQKGDAVVLREKYDWRCMFFFNGRRMRHISGFWVRAQKHPQNAEEGSGLFLARRRHGRSSIFRIAGPDGDALDNFPGVPYVSDDLIWDEDANEDPADEQLPLDENSVDPADPNNVEDDEEVDAEDADEGIEDPEDDEDVEDEEENDGDDVDEEDGEEWDDADLPLEETNKIVAVEPDADGKIPDGNCCNPVNRSKEAKKFTVASLAVFSQAFAEQLGRGNTMIYEHIIPRTSTYPNSMNPSKVYNLGKKPSSDKIAIDLNKMGNKLDNLNKVQARRNFRAIVAKFEWQLEVIDFSVEMLRAAGDDNLEMFERNQKVMHRNVKNFYKTQLAPARFAYKVFSKVPVSQGTVDTLQKNMKAKLSTFETALTAMNHADLDLNLKQNLRRINRNINRIGRRGNRYNNLRRVLRQSRIAFVKINRNVVDKELNKSADFMVHYEAAANALFRVNDAKSVRCLALWALKRRHIHPHAFERQVLNGNNQWTRKIKNQVQDDKLDHQQAALNGAIDQLKQGETHSAVDHGQPQSSQLNFYIDLVFQQTGSLAQQNWEAHNNNEKVKVSVGAFFSHYYGSMGNWRYALKNIAL
jgi:hypothetical protein